MSSKWQIVIASAALSGLIAAHAHASGQSCLTSKEEQFARQFSKVDQILAHELAGLLKHPGDLILLDVRDASEHDVATISGATRVSTGITFDDLMHQIGPSLAEKTVIVFCSVGYRSSKLADRVRSGLFERGVVRVANLRGGVFAWHNYGRPLVDKFGQTDHVHPYSRSWKAYLDFDNLARMTVRTSGTN